MANGGTGSPCGACKFLRRKCVVDCIFAPYFCSEQGPARFAAIHKVFGASKLSKLLLHVPVPYRSEAVVTIAYEAQARMEDPVYGCVAHIYALQQQVGILQDQLMQVKARLEQSILEASKYGRNHITNSMCASTMSSSSSYNPAYDFNCILPQSSKCKIESIEPDSHGFNAQEMTSGSDGFWFQANDKKRMFLSRCNDLGELQALAFN